MPTTTATSCWTSSGARGLERDRRARLLLAEDTITALAGEELVRRITTAMTTGAVAGAAGSLMELFAADAVIRRAEIALELAGDEALARPAGSTSAAARSGRHSLGRQGGALGGGSNEIQRNIISERLLGMPREAAADRDIPHRDVRRSGGR